MPTASGSSTLVGLIQASIPLIVALVALIFAYIRTKKCIYHDDLCKDVTLIKNNIKWIRRHIYKLCSQAKVEVEPEPMEE